MAFLRLRKIGAIPHRLLPFSFALLGFFGAYGSCWSEKQEKSPLKAGVLCRGKILIEGDGAGDMNRTRDLLITNELLYRLSYTGTVHRSQNARL